MYLSRLRSVYISLEEMINREQNYFSSAMHPEYGLAIVANLADKSGKSNLKCFNNKELLDLNFEH